MRDQFKIWALKINESKTSTPSGPFYFSILTNSHGLKGKLKLIGNLKLIKIYINFLKLHLFKICN